MGLFCYYWNRVGLKAVVLEQSDKLRVEGTAITLWNNAMKVMELFDIADQLRNAYVNTTGYVPSPTYVKIIFMWLLEVHFKKK
jgi:2-polyprenyl-6-methoxyphenol hydroxylase-like FAD-dependent oxidoreductase